MHQLDHIVIRLPNAATQEALLQNCEPFKKSFTLSAGGFHTGGASQNVLVSLPDGVYLELIAFTSPPTDHPWGRRKPTSLVDFAFLGHPEKGKAAYQEGRPGGRGECRWIVTLPKEEWGTGNLPFWCEDITARELRVPKAPTHPSGVTAVSKITILVGSGEQRDQLVRMYHEITGTNLDEIVVGTPSGETVVIDVRLAETEEERDSLVKNGQGIYKVEFNVPGVVLCNSTL